MTGSSRFCVYLTHPEVAVDPAVPVPAWGLSETGRTRAARAALLPWAGVIRHVVSSAERKAIETAEIFAAAHRLPVTIVEATHENDRSATGFLPPAEFEEVASAFFAAPGQSVRGWERAIDAQTRIVSAVRQVVASAPAGAPVLFCGHGGVGTLLKCHLLGVGITRRHDQSCGGNWYMFDPLDLERRQADTLDWTAL
ncbi:histidine phosphatase family protein [Pannonibacter tanglangensis]|uniref:Histidine phosphatase family protein n=1 Tax=Pannonibacter tanglangensis TaxID=2750084 RepID=A0ABW9ZSV1_9HYPH|nr:histidine phosphatase family protein [Pannonibacter sp. XCT-34]